MEIVEQLENIRSETLKYFGLPEEDLQKKYGAEKWSVRYVLHHLADSESVLFYRDKISFVHSTAGLSTLKSEFDKVVWHNQQHVGYIQKALS
jgi:DinB superfamily